MGQEEVIKKGWHREAREEMKKQKTAERKNYVFNEMYVLVVTLSNIPEQPQVRLPRKLAGYLLQFYLGYLMPRWDPKSKSIAIHKNLKLP